ncbi:hypothetical protein BJ508DRAFT_312294 [Ascobolus immersus RN42]|uniref:Uncharacterized protein n=1 Tax=Ascobolus immersus RN42 TaxID=1160509 RepID=A0A3N4HRF8_ASCIM|nr:hypothetical protein BJ508DRAFT_312294 [Ascobolus immersus RN42]
MVALAERLVAPELKETAIERLDTDLEELDLSEEDSFCMIPATVHMPVPLRTQSIDQVNEGITAALEDHAHEGSTDEEKEGAEDENSGSEETKPFIHVRDAIQVIRTIYGGTHRPYQAPITRQTIEDYLDASASTPDYTPIANFDCGHRSRWFLMDPDKKTWCKHTRCQNDFIKIRSEYFAAMGAYEETKRRKAAPLYGYKNCKARSVVAKHMARQLDNLRIHPAFRKVVEEIGEFASDLLMEELSVKQSEWVTSA